MGSTTSVLAEHNKRLAESKQLTLHDAVVKLDNLKLESMEALWRSFTETAASFAVSKSELIKILAVLTDTVVTWGDRTEASTEMTRLSTELFEHWVSLSPRKNVEYVDGLEVIAALLCISRLDIQDKVNYLYDCIDCDGDNDLDAVEIALGLKSIMGGLAKAKGESPRSELEVCELALNWFHCIHSGDSSSSSNSSSSSGKNSSTTTVTDIAAVKGKVSREQFVAFCMSARGPVLPVLEQYAAAEGAAHADAAVAATTAAVDALLAAAESKAGAGVAGSAGPGEEFMAIKPWLGAIVAPSKTPRPDPSAPASQLRLEYVHGYRGQGCGNNVRYLQTAASISAKSSSAGSKIVYPAAAVGVVLNLDTNEQQHWLGHSDDVLNMAVSTDGLRIATGELGAKPRICVWSPVTMAAVLTLSGFHRRGVAALDFNSDGTRLVSVGLDDEHSIAVYNTATTSTNSSATTSSGTLLYSSKGNRSRVLDLRCSPYDAQRFVVCGAKHIDFWGSSGGALKCERGLLKTAATAALLCVAWLGPSATVYGSASGTLIACSGREVVPCSSSGTAAGSGKKAVDNSNSSGNSGSNDGGRAAHAGPLNALWVIRSDSSSSGSSSSAVVQGLLTGGKDGHVIRWSVTPTGTVGDRLWAVSLATSLLTSAPGGASPSADSCIRSICLSSDGTKLLLGTQGSEIYELSAPTCAVPGNGSTAAVGSTVLRGGDAVVRGHCKDELWGLAVDATGSEYCTVGDDGMLSLWSVAERRQIAAVSVAGMARACAYSPDGTMIAVGMGGSVGRGKHKYDGAVKIYSRQLSSNNTNNTKSNAPVTNDIDDSDDDDVATDVASGGRVTLKLLTEFHDAKQWISDVKFSPDGKSLAVGAHDNGIYLYTVGQQFKRRAKFAKHNSYITHLDFTADSQRLRSNCGAYELLFSDANTGAQIGSASSLKDAQWSSSTCTLGWAVQGIWPPCADGTDVNATATNSSGRVTATADDNGRVKLFRSPCTVKGAAFREYCGHSSHVTNCRFVNSSKSSSSREERLITVGGNDRCVFQWVHDTEDAAVTTGKASANKLSSVSLEEVDPSLAPAASADSGTLYGNDGATDPLLADSTLTSAGDEFMAVKPWLGAIVEPSPAPAKGSAAAVAAAERLATAAAAVADLQSQLQHSSSASISASLKNALQEASAAADVVQRGTQSDAPSANDLELEWVHGYRAQDCRNNAVYSASGAVVYHAAAVGIALTRDDKSSSGSAKQQFNTVHTDDVLSLALHPEGRLVATGQMGKVPTIQVWDAATMATRTTISGFHTRGVSLLAFSEDAGGTVLVSVGLDDANSVAVYDWRSSSSSTNNTTTSTSSTNISSGKGKTKGVVQTHIPLASSEGERGKTLDVRFKPGSATEFVTVGVKSVKFWTIQGRNLSAKKGSADSNCKDFSDQTFTCVQFIGSQAVVGAANGKLYLFEGTTAVRSISAHCSSADVSKSGASPTVGAAVGGAVYAMHCVRSSGSGKGGDRLITGGKDGRICVWPPVAAAAALHTATAADIDLTALLRDADSADTAVRSVFLSADASKLLVGTQGSELWELSVTLPVSVTATAVTATIGNGGQPLTRGHCKNELWGLATHPGLREYCTAGDDGTLRIWNVRAHAQTASAKLCGMARACAYSPDGSMIAVGMGGSVGKGKQKCDGAVKVFSRTEHGSSSSSSIALLSIAEFHDAKQWISDIKFSPDGASLAVGAHDNGIYLYSIIAAGAGSAEPVQFKKRAKFAKHNSYITHFDFTADSQRLRSNCGAYELLFSDANTGAQIGSASSLKDAQWSSSTCTLGWAVQGIWPPCADGTDINAVCRSSSGAVVATADDSGKVKLFRWPCVTKGARYTEHCGHSSHVTNCGFTAGDECLVTVGGNDRCVFQWRHEVEAESGASLGGSTVGTALSASSGKRDSFDEEQLDPLMFNSDAGGGDMFMAVKPWLGAVKAPSVPPVDNPRAPDLRLQLEWIHGCSDARAAVRYTASGDIAYSAAAVGVLLTPSRKNNNSNSEDESVECHSQRFLQGHTDGVIALAVSPDKRFIATGQSGKKAGIRVWSAANGSQLCSLEGPHTWGIAALVFSPDSTRLASVDVHTSHSHAVWKDSAGSWSGASLEAVGKSDGDTVLWAQWFSLKSSTNSSSETAVLVTGGVKQLKFWSMSGRVLKGKKGVFGAGVSPVALPCACSFLGSSGVGQLVTGTATGQLLLWSEAREVAQVVAAHSTAVTALCPWGDESNSSSGGVVSGSKDGTIKLWSTALKQLCEFNITTLSSSANGCCPTVDPLIRGLDWHPAGVPGVTHRILLVATQGCEIYEVDMGAPGGTPTNPSSLLHSGDPLVAGHCKDELWGLDTAPSDSPDLFVTAGDDASVRVWSMSEKRMLACSRVSERARAVAWDPAPGGGGLLAVGLGGDVGKERANRPRPKTGYIVALKYESSEAGELLSAIPGSEQPARDDKLKPQRPLEFISAIKFSSDGQSLAVGSHDNNIYLYNVNPAAGGVSPPFSHRATFNKAHSFITHLDFGTTGSGESTSVLQCTTGDYELLFCSGADGKHITSAAAVRDAEWSSSTCTLGWGVQGIWPKGADGTDVNACHVSKGLVATVDDFGKLSVFRYPCIGARAEAVVGLGHSSHVTNVKFSHDQSRVLTTGGNDGCILQWAVIKT